MSFMSDLKRAIPRTGMSLVLVSCKQEACRDELHV